MIPSFLMGGYEDFQPEGILDALKNALFFYIDSFF
jgi:hypothetical protein